MMENRIGLIRKPHLVAQPVDYYGVTNGKMYPSDNDSVIEFDGKDILYLEYKQKGIPFNQIKTGQKRLLEAQVNNWCYKPGNHGMALIVYHEAKEYDDRIWAEDSFVGAAYTVSRKWTEFEPIPLKKFLNRVGVIWNQPKLSFK